jgi:Matrixin/PEP-CTERM motif
MLTAAAVLLGICLSGTASADPIGTQWPQSDGPGSPLVITYSYSNLLDGAFLMLSAGELRAATEEALSLWASVAPLHFIERSDTGPAPTDNSYEPYAHPAIRFGHHTSPERAHGFYPNEFDGLGGDVHFATGAPWAIGGEFDFLETVVHEVGHALGLGHELVQLSVMNPIPAQRFGRLGSAFLFPIDVQQIQSIYGAGQGSVSPVPEPSTLLLVAGGWLGGRLVRRRKTKHERRKMKDEK